mmetsp:Transcript_12916/g.27022  ORF Transcript_12916/g.27022 Transcript_12916/m.27022 type:complete len:82 (-) Transcript_12916:228-473(-)
MLPDTMGGFAAPDIWGRWTLGTYWPAMLKGGPPTGGIDVGGMEVGGMEVGGMERPGMEAGGNAFGGIEPCPMTMSEGTGWP